MLVLVQTCETLMW